MNTHPIILVGGPSDGKHSTVNYQDGAALPRYLKVMDFARGKCANIGRYNRAPGERQDPHPYYWKPADVS